MPHSYSTIGFVVVTAFVVLMYYCSIAFQNGENFARLEDIPSPTKKLQSAEIKETYGPFWVIKVLARDLDVSLGVIDDTADSFQHNCEASLTLVEQIDLNAIVKAKNNNKKIYRYKSKVVSQEISEFMKSYARDVKMIYDQDITERDVCRAASILKWCVANPNISQMLEETRLNQTEISKTQTTRDILTQQFEFPECDFICALKDRTENVSCYSVDSFFTPHQILEGLRSKWLYFIGDSCTRGMVAALATLLDPSHTHPIDFQRWFNVTPPGSIAEDNAVDNWLGHGGDFQRLDYIFRRQRRGKWTVRYKKASLISPICHGLKKLMYQIPFQNSTFSGMMDKYYDFPEVYSPESKVGPDEVRISFNNARYLSEVHQAWESMSGVPDIVYVSVGVWGFAENDSSIDLLTEIKSAVPTFVWGSQQGQEKTQYSMYDLEILEMEEKWLFLDRSRIPRTELGKKNHLQGPHYSHLVNTADLMSLFRVLGWKQNGGNHPNFCNFCVVRGEPKQLLGQYNITVPLPFQGWKTPWKLPCRFTL